MSDWHGKYNRRSKTKKERHKAHAVKAIKHQKIRKTCLTREYRDTEREVQVLLENSSLTIDISSTQLNGDNESESINFFYGTSEEETSRTTTDPRYVHSNDEMYKKLLQTEIFEEAEENEDYEQQQQSDDNASEQRTPTKLSAAAGFAARIQADRNESRTATQATQLATADSFIQIAVEEAVTTERPVCEKFMHASDLLYTPNKNLNLSIQLGSEQPATQLPPTTRQMLNRYHEEAKSVDKKLSRDVITALLDAQTELDYIDSFQIYRTHCEYRFNPVFCEPAREVTDIPTRQFIKLYLKELRFTQHPQLLEEHSLANKLEELYDKYATQLNERKRDKLYCELLAERRIVSDLIKRAAAQSEFTADAEQHAHTLECHLLSVKALRNQYYEEAAANKQLLKDILDTWMKLKQQRQAQKFQCTRIKMCLKVNVPEDINAERKKHNERFEADLNEIYREELEFYYRTRRIWQTESAKNAKTGIKKPIKPDISKLSEELQQRYANCFYAPDEPRIAIYKSHISGELFYNMPGVPKLKSFFMKIYFDGQYVGVTRSYRLENDLHLYINEALGVFVERRLPQDVRIALYEKSKLPKPKKIANIYVPIMPNAAQLLDQQTRKVAFSAKQQLRVQGVLLLRFECDNEMYPSDVLAIKVPSRVQGKHSKEWWLQRDDQEPLVNPTTENESSSEDEATAVDDPKELDTCTFEETLLRFAPLNGLEQNARLKLLRSRYLKQDARTKDLRFIPALDNELEFDWEDDDEVVIDVGNWMDPINVHKYQGKKYLKKLYEAIQMQCARLSKVMENAENLLSGDEPATWSALLQALMSIFQPSRPLNPARNLPFGMSKATTTKSAKSNAIVKYNIIMNVVRATGIPIRSAQLLDNMSSRQPSSDGSGNMLMAQTFKYSNVRPFVVLAYRDKLCRTMTVEGSNPTWNEQLTLSLSGSLSDFRDDIKILLFDEVIEQQMADDLSMRNADIYQRIQANWLGEYRIPIRALIKKQKLEGVFEFNVPKLLVGYKRPSFDNLSRQGDTNLLIEQYPEIKEAVHLWFFISMEPMIDLPQVSTKCLDCAELRDVRNTLQEWTLLVQEQQPQQRQRFIEPLVCTMTGKRVCMTRLLEAIPLPIQVSENLLASVCRYVAMLNTPKHYDACMELDGIWLDNQSVLDTTWCSAKDLGVLLCNYLLTIGLKTWLILGSALPNGDCTYVLFRNDGEVSEYLLIDPATGKHYSIKDVLCPLQQIYYVVAKDNIYCNIQSQSRVSLTNFNFNDSACWLPAFSKRKPAPLGGVHKLNYQYISSCNTADLRKNIERKIMKKINSWRTTRKTVWNRAFQPRLLAILEQLESLATFGSNGLAEIQLNERLILEYPNYKIYGFTLNFSYINLTTIGDRIKATGIHLNSDKNVEYSLAVHIHAYTNNLLSVWIFIISTIPV